jgi:leucyl/phenylalanyl-tRNA--protein transferase
MSAGITAEDLLSLYAQGVFPMAQSRDDPTLYVVDPPERGILPLDDFHLTRRLARTVRQGRFEIRIDTAFAAVVDGCAGGGPDRPDSWINPEIRRLYLDLKAQGFAHSVEAWRDDTLVGGLYGVRLGAAFFGESMFSRETDASKVALVHLVARLRAGAFQLLDCQFQTDHLAQFGVRAVPRRTYRALLKRAIALPSDFYGLTLDATGADALQAISHRS